MLNFFYMIKIPTSLAQIFVFATLLTITNIGCAAETGDVVTGGVGKDEMQRIENIQNEYNLKLTFAAANGHFLSDIRVQITDASGQSVLITTTEGPVLLAKFAPGKYTIFANNAGGSKTQTIMVGTSLKKLGIILPEADNLSKNLPTQQYLENKGFAVDLAFPA